MASTDLWATLALRPRCAGMNSAVLAKCFGCGFDSGCALSLATCTNVRMSPCGKVTEVFVTAAKPPHPRPLPLNLSAGAANAAVASPSPPLEERAGERRPFDRLFAGRNWHNWQVFIGPQALEHIFVAAQNWTPLPDPLPFRRGEGEASAAPLRMVGVP